MSFYRIKKTEQYLVSEGAIPVDIQMPDLSVGIVDGWVVFEYNNTCYISDWTTAEYYSDNDINFIFFLSDCEIEEL